LVRELDRGLHHYSHGVRHVQTDQHPHCAKGNAPTYAGADAGRKADGKMKWKGKEIPAWAVKWGLIVLCVIVALAYFRYAKDSWRPWTNAEQPAAQPSEPKEIHTIERIVIQGPATVRVIETVKYLEKVPGALTPQTAADNNAHVIASAKIPPSPAGGTATGILQYGPDGVGTGRIEWKPATPRFLQIKKSFGAEGWYYPIGDRQAEASLVANPLRIGPIEIKAKVGAAVMRENSQIRGFVAIGGEWQF